MTDAVNRLGKPGGAPRGPLDLRMMPLALYLGLLLGGGVLFVVAQSLGFAPWYGTEAFPSLRAYQAVVSRPGFWTSAGLTLYYAALASAISIVLGCALALSTRATTAQSAALQRLVELPLVVPYGVGIALAALMMGNGGLVSRLAAGIGLIDTPAQFPRLLDTHSGWGVIAVYVWKQTPFVAVSIAAVLGGRARALEDAARVLGARPAQVFRDVTLPTIAPALASAALIGFAFNVGAFEAPLILGGGHPRVLPVIAWELLSDPDVSRQLEAMAIAVLLSGIVIVAALGNLAMLRRLDPTTGGR